jgi:hypothetical protein
MYKTVRHGENSLQYTILPQDPDSAAACTVTTTKHTTSSGRTAVLVAICVILVGSVVAAVVVPLLVSARLVLPAPHRRALSVQNSFTITTTPSTTVTTIPSESAFNWSTSTISISSSEVPLNTTVKITQTESPTTSPPPPPPRVWSIVVPNTTQAPVLTSTPQFINTTSTLNEGQQRTITITNSPLTTTITNRPHKSWLPSRWPFVDPANTYARWTVRDTIKHGHILSGTGTGSGTFKNSRVCRVPGTSYGRN